MNNNLQEEIGFLVDALIKWQPDMSITGIVDFCQNIAKLQFIGVYKKTILELRANRYDGLANTLETYFEVFQKDVTEREKKRYAKDEDQPVFDRILSEYKITKPAHLRSSDVYLAFMHIALSKRHLIDVLKKIAELPEMSAEQNGGNTSVVNKITISDSQIGSVQAGVNNKSNSNAEQHKNTEEKKSVFWKIISWAVAAIAGTIIVDIFGNFG